MDVAAYQAISPKLLENEFLGNKYAGTFGAPVEYACQLMNKPAEPIHDVVDDLCDFFIEENEYTASASRMLDNIRNDEILWWRKRVGKLRSGTKSGASAILLLQAGDLGAFLAAQISCRGSRWENSMDEILRKAGKGQAHFPHHAC